jgi:hypothetical protein
MMASVHCKAESRLFLEWIASQVWPALESKTVAVYLTWNMLGKVGASRFAAS